MAKSKAGKNVEDRLAKMAGIKNDRKSDESDVYDSESGDDNDSDRIRGKMRSDKVKNESSKGSGGWRIILHVVYQHISFYFAVYRIVFIR